MVYRKATSSNIYLHYTSHHADCIKMGVIKCLTKRAEVVCSEEETTTKETAYLKEVFRGNGYPTGYIKRAMKSRGTEERAREGPEEEPDDRPQEGIGLRFYVIFLRRRCTWCAKIDLRFSRDFAQETALRVERN